MRPHTTLHRSGAMTILIQKVLPLPLSVKNRSRNIQLIYAEAITRIDPEGTASLRFPIAPQLVIRAMSVIITLVRPSGTLTPNVGLTPPSFGRRRIPTEDVFCIIRGKDGLYLPLERA